MWSGGVELVALFVHFVPPIFWFLIFLIFFGKVLVALADEIAKAGIPEGSRKINGKFIQSHLLSRLEGLSVFLFFVKDWWDTIYHTHMYLIVFSHEKQTSKMLISCWHSSQATSPTCKWQREKEHENKIRLRSSCAEKITGADKGCGCCTVQGGPCSVDWHGRGNHWNFHLPHSWCHFVYYAVRSLFLLSEDEDG